jgi:Tfp pilus assembly protein PilN
MTAQTPTMAEQPAPGPGSAQRVRVEWAPVPQVNLLPPEILAKRRFRRLQWQLGGCVLAVLVGCAAVTVWSQLGVSAAEQDLAVAKDQGVQLQRQQVKYAEAPKVRGELDTLKAVRETALGTDVAWYQFLQDLAVNTPTGTQLSSVTITMTGAAVAATSTTPFTPANLGSVKVSGQARQFTDVASWLDAVDRVHGLAGSGLDTAVKSTTTSQAGSGSSSSGSPSGATGAGSTTSLVTFNGTAVVVPAALSHRYDRKAS